MNKVLITGGAGFIGSHLAEACCDLPEKPEVVVLDNLRSGKRSHIERLRGRPGYRWVEGSIADAALVEECARGADCIFHLAALVSVAESLDKPRECLDLNVGGLLNVIDAARRQAVPKIVFSSSAAVYGNDPELPKRESMRPDPLTPYGITKLDGEYYLEMARREYGISSTSLRYFNVYGPGQDPASQYAAAVPIFFERARRGEPITIHGDGLQTRDFVYVQDVAAANLWVAHRPDLTGTYNVATGTTVTILELAGRIRELTGSQSPIRHAPPRPGDIRASWSDPGKLKSTGFATRFSLEQGLSEMVKS